MARSRKKIVTQAPAVFVHPEWPWVGWLRRNSILAAVLLVVVGSVRIVSTYWTFSHTSDEPAHIACGMEWLDKGVYRYEAQHPPLARVATAILPYLAGLRSHGLATFNDEGVAILYDKSQYDRNLALARFGILPFFWIASAVLYIWGRRFLDEAGALLALFLFTFLPPVLAHAALATTDMPLTAILAAAFLAAVVWVEKPTVRHSAIFGACTALAVLSKFSSLPFLPAAMLAALIACYLIRRPSFPELWRASRARLAPFGIAVLTALPVIWAGYRFSFGPVTFANLRLPAPELYNGIVEVFVHNYIGHLSYLFGTLSQGGFWYYFPVLLFYKNPLPFLVLLGIGTFFCLRKAGRKDLELWLALAFSLGILLFSMTSRINIGLRHILPVYFGFSLVAAKGASDLLDKARAARWRGALLLVLLAVYAANSLAAHPDYLAYFNIAAGDSPERVAVDSDLDWGQDIKRLAHRLQELGVQQLTFTTGIAGAQRMLPPTVNGYIEEPNPGWNAVSVTNLKQRMGLGLKQPQIVPWPEYVKPQEKIQNSIWLYYFPPARR